MNSQSYYRTDDANGCDLAVSDQFLAVNCAGVSALNRPFRTWRPEGRQDYYLMYLYRGTLAFQLHGMESMCQAGQFVLFEPGCATGYSKSDDQEMIYYWVHFSGSGAAGVLADCRLSGQTLYHAGVDPVAIDCFHELFSQFLSRDAYFQLAAASLLQQILLRLKRGADQRMDSGISQQRLARSLAFIHQHYNRSLKVRELADIEHLSVSRYSALFRACIGQPPQAYIIDQRLRMAAELLQRTDLSVKQVAHTVGYADQLYFSRLFRARSGLSPRQFQLQHQALKMR